jgi:squalene cyclase
LAEIIGVKVKEALAAGVAFLVTRQGRDGLWRDFETLAGEASDWPTGFIGAQLLTAGVRDRSIDAATAALRRHQHRDGGWGYHRHVPSDADSTACVLIFLAAAGSDNLTMERAGRCLQRHQDPRSGGIATYADPEPIRRYMGVGRHVDLRGWCAHHVEVTATAGYALAAVPGDRFRADAMRAWQYVRSRQSVDGGWSSYWWSTRHYPTLQAVALAVALGDPDPVARAAEWALGEQLPGGGWSALGTDTSAFATALSLAVVLRDGACEEALRLGVHVLVGLQQDDGGWPSHPAMRVPPPGVAEPDGYQSWRADDLGTGVILRDHHRLFTTAVCVSALALAARSVA